MPLALESSSHGRVAFGFSHFDSGVLLLKTRFLFAEPFCAAIPAPSARDPRGFPRRRS